MEVEDINKSLQDKNFDTDFLQSLVHKSEDQVWYQANGEKLFVENMTEAHAKNALRLMIRKYKPFSTKTLYEKSFYSNDYLDECSYYEKPFGGAE